MRPWRLKLQTSPPKRHVASVLESGCWHEGVSDAASLGYIPNVYDTLGVVAQVREVEDVLTP